MLMTYQQNDMKEKIDALQVVANVFPVLQAKVENLEQKVESFQSTSHSPLTNERAIQEVQKRISRSKNLLIFNVPENNSLLEDKIAVIDILSATNVNMDCIKVVHIGNQISDKPRPILIPPNTQQDAVQVLKNRNKLNKTYRVAANKTSLQQNQYKADANEQLLRTKAGEKNLMLRTINNIPTSSSYQNHNFM
ncbi:hypothetical protein QAD02_007572 [Eretmocerus hayati]|uniref:Uncharacterized protein n=1 Tax=Eretmocerus hayati TaxID=131215 RepID=A0ACC2N8E7_9HYME|nr:hypothetical protein QAD02_007572 [Eretmocerus hayati]